MCAKKQPEEDISCSFCGKLPKDVELMIAGGEQLAICNECVMLCMAHGRRQKNIGYPESQISWPKI